MMKRSRFVQLVGALLLAGLASGPLRAHGVEAKFSVCRSDPVIALSDGKSVTITDSISDASTDLQHITYVLHAPTGVTVSRVTYTAGMSAIESLQFYADQTAGHYVAGTQVTTKTSPTAPVSLSVTISRVTKTASGTAGQLLTVSY
jgi:hypothetical protein